MKWFAVLALLPVVLIAGCAQNLPANGPAGTQELLLSEQDLQKLGMAADGDCQTEEQSSIYSSMVQYTVCFYNISSLGDTEVVLELKKFTNFEDLNGTYQYDSSHLFSVQGLISENDFGDQSRFRVNNENDYGGQFNEPGVYYYHLWITKDLYLIHITSSGTEEAAREVIAETGRQILSKF